MAKLTIPNETLRESSKSWFNNFNPKYEGKYHKKYVPPIGRPKGSSNIEKSSRIPVVHYKTGFESFEKIKSRDTSVFDNRASRDFNCEFFSRTCRGKNKTADIGGAAKNKDFIFRSSNSREAAMKIISRETLTPVKVTNAHVHRLGDSGEVGDSGKWYVRHKGSGSPAKKKNIFHSNTLDVGRLVKYPINYEKEDDTYTEKKIPTMLVKND